MIKDRSNDPKRTFTPNFGGGNPPPKMKRRKSKPTVDYVTKAPNNPSDPNDVSDAEIHIK
jgi:hypothetical protein